MIEISERDFEKEVLECELPVFSCFTTGWCQTCYPTCLISAELAKEYDRAVKFVKVDVEESPRIAEQYHITVVPTILIFQGSQAIKKLLSFQEQSYLKSILDSLVAERDLSYG